MRTGWNLFSGGLPLGPLLHTVGRAVTRLGLSIFNNTDVYPLSNKATIDEIELQNHAQVDPPSYTELDHLRLHIYGASGQRPIVHPWQHWSASHVCSDIHPTLPRIQLPPEQQPTNRGTRPGGETDATETAEHRRQETRNGWAPAHAGAFVDGCCSSTWPSAPTSPRTAATFCPSLCRPSSSRAN